MSEDIKKVPGENGKEFEAEKKTDILTDEQADQVSGGNDLDTTGKFENDDVEYVPI